MDEEKIPKQKIADVNVKKPGFFRSAYNLFIRGSFESARDHVITEIIQPAIANMIVDSVNSVVSTIFRGDSAPISSGSRIGYRSSFSTRRPASEPKSAKQLIAGGVSRFSAADYVIPDRKEAERVYFELQEDFTDYGYIRVSDFLGCFGITPRSSEFNYGWRSFDGVRVSAVYGGYILTFPTPVPIN